MAITCASVNAALKKMGVEERLVRGDGYFYFTGGDSSNWAQSSVYVYRASDLTIPQWIEEYERLKAQRHY